MGKVTFRLYGMFALNAKKERLEVELESCKPLKELLQELFEGLGLGKVDLDENLEPYALILVDGKPSNLNVEICGGEEISILPPAVGG